LKINNQKFTFQSQLSYIAINVQFQIQYPLNYQRDLTNCKTINNSECFFGCRWCWFNCFLNLKSNLHSRKSIETKNRNLCLLLNIPLGYNGRSDFNAWISLKGLTWWITIFWSCFELFPNVKCKIKLDKYFSAWTPNHHSIKFNY